MPGEITERFWIVALRLYALVIGLIGIALAIGGGYLITLGGSPYYVLIGLVIGASAVLLWQRRMAGALLYGLALLVTFSWAVWEVGYDAWALLPRLMLPLVAGFVLLVPGIRRAMQRRSVPYPRGSILAAIAMALAAGPLLRGIAPPQAAADPLYQIGRIAASTPHALTSRPADTDDWMNYGNDVGGTRYTSLSQITPANVKQLEPAWSFHLGVIPGGIEATPIEIGNTLYVCTSTNDVLALDANTGKQLWRYNAHIDIRKVSPPICRGVSYFRASAAAEPCAERIIMGTLDARLVALDAHTGQPCRNFGTDGAVSLLTGLGQVMRGYYYETSAPLVTQGKIILGGAVADNQSTDEPSGVIRAFDALSGKLLWAWDLGKPQRQGEPPPGEHYTRSTPNSWVTMSADLALGLVYVPMGNPTPDYFGGRRRPFDEAYGSAVVALDIATGRPRWAFQTTHHDVWDYDNSGQATLADYTTPNGVVHALLQPTKRGELFVIDRATGKPLRPVQERAAPQTGAVPEERLSPTQPFSVGMPSFRGPDLRESDMWGITPLDQLWCRIKFREARYEGPLTPPGLTPSIEHPGFLGGMEWGGVAYDANREIVVINSNLVPSYARLVRRSEADQLGLKPFDDHDQALGSQINHAAQQGTPYGVLISPFLSPLFVPCSRPPFGRLSAVDLKTGKLIWTRTLGTARDSGPLGIPSMLPLPLGTPNLGGAVVTQSGLIFIGSTQDKYLRAFETTTGQQLWRARLPSSAQATPMTYRSNGRQYVVIASGGHKMFPAPTDVYINAYALPTTPERSGIEPSR